MEILRTVGQVRDRVRRARGDGSRIGLVPTMGALHEGHLSLVRLARRDCDLVVVSLFVNPTQFGEPSDLAAYPRTETQDAALAEGAGADVLFVPEVAEVYPAGFATNVRVAGVSERWEGAHRGAAHFDGVATVVAKLFAMVAPDLAYFGQKDAQQVAVVRRMVTDLNLPVEVRVGPTVREPDGLAMSSRNVRLGPEDRQRALALRAGLDAVLAVARAAVLTGASGPDEAVRAGLEAMRGLGVEPEYLAVVDPESLRPVPDLSGPGLAVVAARVGNVRLIDNMPVGGGRHPPEGGLMRRASDRQGTDRHEDGDPDEEMGDLDRAHEISPRPTSDSGVHGLPSARLCLAQQPLVVGGVARLDDDDVGPGVLHDLGGHGAEETLAVLAQAAVADDDEVPLAVL